MGFFKDFKRDFAQAVNELMPDKNELSGEYDDEDMVNTFDDGDNMDIAPEDMMEDLDDYTIDDKPNYDNIKSQEKYEEEIPEYEEESVEPEQDSLADIPNAEIISEPISDENYDAEASAMGIPEELTSKVEQDDTVFVPNAMEEAVSDAVEEEASDELVEEDALSDEDMQENLADVVAIEPENSDSNEDDEVAMLMGKSMNLAKDVSDAYIKREEQALPENTVNVSNDWEDRMSEVEKIQTEELEKENNIDGILSDDTTYITKGTTIKGSIETEGGIDIIGTVIGDVTCAGKLILGGTIEGNVNAGEIYANAAKIEGEVLSDGSVKIGVGSVIVGNINATTAVIAGAVNGDIDVKGPVIVDSTAVIMGNIKSRSVQINNGAVIEGFCSQCYSEIDVKSFFE